MKDVIDNGLDPVDGFLLEMLGDYHRHLCSVCDGSPDGCINCRKTGYDQTPCKICDKDGIAFRNRKEFLYKVATLFTNLETQARINSLLDLERWAKLHNLNAEQILEGIEHMVISNLQVPDQPRANNDDRIAELKSKGKVNE